MQKVTGPGSYKAKPQSWRADCNDNGKPFANVKFDNGLWWRGWLVGGAIQYTVDALHLMGFKGSSAQDLNDNPNALNTSVEVDVQVDWIKNQDGSQWRDKNGQPRLEVTGVWPPYTPKEVDPQNVQVLKGLDLRGYLAESKKNQGDAPNQGQAQQSQTARPQDGQSFTADDIPF